MPLSFILEEIADDVRACLLARLVEVGVDIRCGGQIAVPEEVRHIDERHVLADEQTCEGMPQVMESDVSQTVFFQQFAVRRVTYDGRMMPPS